MIKAKKKRKAKIMKLREKYKKAGKQEREQIIRKIKETSLNYPLKIILGDK